MASVAFDTFEFNKSLRDAGFSELQAEALTKAQTKAMEQVHKDADYVSRAELKTDIQELRKDMQSLEQGIRKDIQLSEQGLRKEMAEMKSDIFRAMLLQVFAIAGLLVAVVKFMQA